MNPLTRIIAVDQIIPQTKKPDISHPKLIKPDKLPPAPNQNGFDPTCRTCGVKRGNPIRKK